MSTVRILGIESSCDETGVAIYDEFKGIIGHQLYSQVELHQEYGGVVPELASRDHVRKIIPLIDRLMQQANCMPSDIDAIAYTQGPGLVGALLVGATVAKSLAFAWKKPSLGIHHLEGHLLAPMLEERAPDYPFLALLVSGGHTMLVDVRKLGDYEIIGESIDDAAGEAFDKTAKIMGLDYPGGPLLAKLAEKGNGNEVKFPRPMTDRAGLDFSFSGLKTFAANRVAVMNNKVSENPNICQLKLEQNKANIAQAFQEAVVDTLSIKCKRALKQTGHKNLVVAGGVSANISLRQKLASLMNSLNGQVYYPRQAYCTDNGAMIAYAGFCRFKLSQKQFSENKFPQSGQEKASHQTPEADGYQIEVFPRWPISSL